MAPTHARLVLSLSPFGLPACPRRHRRCSNIKEARFGVEYFRGFDLVINALDNVAARKHVNRLCLATGRPLVEAGTAGYLGQAYPIRKGVTECFECTPPPAQKTFPICTIRR